MTRLIAMVASLTDVSHHCPVVADLKVVLKRGSSYDPPPSICADYFPQFSTKAKVAHLYPRSYVNVYMFAANECVDRSFAHYLLWLCYIIE